MPRVVFLFFVWVLQFCINYLQAPRGQSLGWTLGFVLGAVWVIPAIVTTVTLMVTRKDPDTRRITPFIIPVILFVGLNLFLAFGAFVRTHGLV